MYGMRICNIKFGSHVQKSGWNLYNVLESL